MPVQYIGLVNCARIQYSEKGNDKNIHNLNYLTSNFPASNLENSSGFEISKASYFPGQLPYERQNLLIFGLFMTGNSL